MFFDACGNNLTPGVKFRRELRRYWACCIKRSDRGIPMVSNSIPALVGINGWSRIPQTRRFSRDRAYTFPITASGVFLAHGLVTFIMTLACEGQVNKCPLAKGPDKPLSTDGQWPRGPRICEVP